MNNIIKIFIFFSLAFSFLGSVNASNYYSNSKSYYYSSKAYKNYGYYNDYGLYGKKSVYGKYKKKFKKHKKPTIYDSGVIPGYVVHGVNVFNDEYLVDYSQVSPNIPFLMPSPPTYEIGAYAPGNFNSDTITSLTDTSRLVATNSRFSELFGLPIDPAIHNIPLNKVSSNFFGSSSLLDRSIPKEFSESGETDIYHRTKSNTAPTIKEWNKVRGQVSYSCKTDDSATVKVEIASAFPNAVYTMWDVGASNPLTAGEAPYGVPLGGLPNILTTDDYGCAETTLELPYCPSRKCEAGAKSCTSYLSIAHHWDEQGYGASPSLSFAGIPVGAYAGNHMVWPMSGQPLRAPHTKWQPRKVKKLCGR